MLLFLHLFVVVFYSHSQYHDRKSNEFVGVEGVGKPLVGVIVVPRRCCIENEKDSSTLLVVVIELLERHLIGSWYHKYNQMLCCDIPSGSRTDYRAKSTRKVMGYWVGELGMRPGVMDRFGMKRLVHLDESGERLVGWKW